MRFLGLSVSQKGPDAKTIWLFREHLTRAGAIEKLFAVFDERLRGSGYLAKSGQIVDATLIAALRQHNSDDEKQALKEGRVSDEWRAKPHKLAQKDRDARWTLKRDRVKKAEAGGKAPPAIAIPVFGYKNHVSIDRAHGFVRRFAVSSAAEHDSRRFREVLDKRNTGSKVWADTAYRSKKNEAFLERHGLVSQVHFRRAPGKDLSEKHKRANAARSKERAHVEHVFARQKGPMALFVRTIGMVRATFKIGMANLAYNMKRLVFWHGKTAPA